MSTDPRRNQRLVERGTFIEMCLIQHDPTQVYAETNYTVHQSSSRFRTAQLQQFSANISLRSGFPLPVSLLRSWLPKPSGVSFSAVPLFSGISPLKKSELGQVAGQKERRFRAEEPASDHGQGEGWGGGRQSRLYCLAFLGSRAKGQSLGLQGCTTAGFGELCGLGCEGSPRPRGSRNGGCVVQETARGGRRGGGAAEAGGGHSADGFCCWLLRRPLLAASP